MQFDPPCIGVTIRAHWVNAAVLVPFTRPFVVIDGHETGVRWRHCCWFQVQPGDHRVEAFVRYRTTSRPLGRGGVQVTTVDSEAMQVRFRNGALNTDPFRGHVVSLKSLP